MGNLPVLTALAAFLTVICMFAGADGLVGPLMVLALLMAVAALVRPGGDSPADGRTLAAFSIVFALLPIIKPWIEGIATARKERARAAFIAPIQKRLEGDFAGMGPSLDAFAQKAGRYPAAQLGTAMPLIAPDGRRVPADQLPSPAIPADPFDSASRGLSMVPVGARGVLVISVGQDGVAEWPDARDLLNIDADPNDPLAPIASRGSDWRTITYDPTNGALAPGDVVFWHAAPGEKATREDILKPLSDAWDTVTALTPPPAKAPKRGEPEPPPLAESDAKTASLLLADGEWLAALAVASRAAANRRPNPAFWKDPLLRQTDLVRARALFELGHPRAAADKLLDYLAVEPNDPEAHWLLGVCMWMGGRREEAQRHFAAGFQIDPSHPAAPRSLDCWQAIEGGRQPVLPVPAFRQASAAPPAASGPLPATP